MPLCCSSCPHSYRCPFLHLNTLILKAFAFASTRLSQKWKYSPQATEKLYKKMKHILWLKNQTKQIKNCWDFAKCTLRQIYLKYWVYVCLMVLHTWSTMNLWDVLIQSVNKNETHYTKKNYLFDKEWQSILLENCFPACCHFKIILNMVLLLHKINLIIHK